MNTMHRNVEYDGNIGYVPVQESFNGTASTILRTEDIQDGNDLLQTVCNELQIPDQDDEEKLKKRLNDLKEKCVEIKGTTLFPEVKKNETISYQHLQEIIGKMPKGGLLHVHSTVGLSAEDLLILIVEWNQDDNIRKGEDEKIFYLKEAISKEVDGKKYDIPEKTLMFQRQFDQLSRVLQIEGFENMIEEVTESNCNDIKNFLFFDTIKDWTEFKHIFIRTKSLFENRDFYRLYHQKFFENCIENKIFYVEIRTGFQEFTDFSNHNAIGERILFFRPGFTIETVFHHENMLTDTNPTSPDIEFLSVIESARENAIHNKKISQDKFQLKVILTANRNSKMEAQELENVLKKMDAAIVIKNLLSYGEEEIKIPDIVGFDLVSQEMDDIGTTQAIHKHFYENFGCGYNMGETQEIQVLFEELKKYERIKLIRFFLHDGESVGKITNREDNAITAPICSRHRIGHGFKMGAEQNFSENPKAGEYKYGNNIVKYILYGCSSDVENVSRYPIRKEQGEKGEGYFRKDRIAEPVIELCPISNQLLGYTPDLSNHPAKTLIKHGIFAVISNDDPQIFDNPGLNYDYLMAFLDGILDYDQMKISVFLGYFYRVMQKYYYIKEKGIWKVNDKMEIGILSERIEEADNDSEVTEFMIYNKAKENFMEDWSSFVEGIICE